MATSGMGKPHGLKDHVHPTDANHLAARQGRKATGGVGRKNRPVTAGSDK